MIYNNSTYHVDLSWSQPFVNFNSALSAIPTIYDDSGLIDTTQSNLVRSQWNIHLLENADFPFTLSDVENLGEMIGRIDDA